MKITDWYGENSQFGISGEKLDSYCHVIDESFDGLVSELEPYADSLSFKKKDADSFFSLESFRPQKELCPKIWIDGIINSRVRLRLLDIADDFVDFLSVDWTEPIDIILTGSLSNYNWSKYSDFDLHILMDFTDIDINTDLVKEYFNSKKNEWNTNHENLRIYGFPVELYVQDVNEEHTASGVYSLEKNEWLVKPSRDNIKSIKLNKYFIKEKAHSFAKKILEFEDIIKNETDGFKLTKIGIKIKNLFDKLKGLRKSGLSSDGEMSSGNIIYKLLRRTGFLEKLLEIKNISYDKEKSLS